MSSLKSFVNSIISVNIIAGSAMVFMHCVFTIPLSYDMQQNQNHPTYWERLFGIPISAFGMFLGYKMLVDS